MMKIGRWAILGLVVACSSAEQNGNGALLDAQMTGAEQDLLGGTVVAEVALSQTHRVRFIELDGGGVVLDESGAEHDFDQRIEDGALDNLTFSEQFQALQARAGRSGQTPAKLIEAETRAKALKPQNLPPPPAEPAQPDVADENLDAQYINKTTDAYDWTYTVCNSNYFDANYCKTNVTGVMQGATMYTMQWESYCKAASEIAAAVHWTQYWNGSSWGEKIQTPVAARTWRRVTDSTIAVRRSGCEGQSPEPLVHYNVRYRFAPSTFTTIGAYWPDHVSRDLDNDHQGVTNDGNNWYFTNAISQWEDLWNNAAKDSYIWKIPLGTDVGTSSPSVTRRNPWASEYDHFGGVTYVADKKVIAIGIDKTESGVRGAVGFLNTDLSPLGYAVLPVATDSAGNVLANDQAGGCPWVAYNPKDKLLYSSAFNPQYLNKYRIDSTSPPKLSYAGYVSIRNTSGSLEPLYGIQGGAFSASGKLYLAEERPRNPVLLTELPQGGLVILDPWTGRIHGRKDVYREFGDEFAGPTIWDLDADRRDSRITGQVHISVLENDYSNDNFFFRHLRADTIGNL